MRESERVGTSVPDIIPPQREGPGFEGNFHERLSQVWVNFGG
jgi:hypothetical protein